ncbi:hypothetical protein BpHYR1_039644 [Brachionus plicatilis]|uniref:Uncharacterized protein n=1 Tax=Brachionus plicatilis TaxID=10195 RepID=A0A3M7S7M0_BRAPC|nr:hypothetical protein BpHYR1_039644 [Brachionus plicatilis]
MSNSILILNRNTNDPLNLDFDKTLFFTCMGLFLVITTFVLKISDNPLKSKLNFQKSNQYQFSALLPNLSNQEIDNHFERQIEKIEKSPAKFDSNILVFIHTIEILNTQVEILNLINLVFIDLDQINPISHRKNRYSNLYLVKNYDSEELPNSDIDDILKIEAKDSSSFVNSNSKNCKR